MKKLLLLLFASVCCCYSFAQITIITTDMPVAPTTLYAAVDTAPGVSVGSSGANLTWNFASLAHDKTDTIRHIVPSTTTFASTFPAATDAETLNNTQYAYSENTSSAYTALGLAGDLLNNGSSSLAVTFSPTYDVYRFPTQYSGNFNGTYGFTKTASGSSVGESAIYQVRVTYTSDYTDTIDGWGTCITPLGSYNCLRQRHQEFTETLIETQLFSISPWTTYSDTHDTTLAYNWLAKESKGPVVTLNVNTHGAVTSASYSLAPPVVVPPTFHAAINGPTQLCSNDSTGIGYSDTLRSGNTYNWIITGGSLASGAGTSAITVNWNDSGVHNITLIECDSGNVYCDTANLSVVINPSPGVPTISQNGDTLTATAGGIYYNWYEGSNLLSDSTNTLVITQNGNYTAKIFDTIGCSSTSAVYPAVYTGIVTITDEPLFSLYPNPTVGALNIKLSGLAQTGELVIRCYDATGRMVIDQTQTTRSGTYNGQLNMQELPSGLYLIRVEQSNWNITRKVSVER